MEEFIDEDLLGICIPTFNRATYLDVCLNSIINEVSKFNFTIYISDNASTDGTEGVISEYKKRYHRIVHVRNETNLGLYRNILNVIKLAKTEYIWLMGDDDAIKEDSIDIMISNLKKGYDYIIVNSTPYDEKLEKAKHDKVITCKNNKVYRRGEIRNLLVDLKKWAYHGFISSMIVRTSIIQELIPKYENKNFVLYDNSWPLIAIFYEPFKDYEGLFLCDPIVKNRDNPRPSGKDAWNYLYIDHIKVMEYLGSIGYDYKLLRRALDFNTLDTLFITIFSKCSNPNVSLFNNFIKKDGIMPFYIKSIIFLIDRFPLILLVKFRNVIDKLRHF
jgi:glycosyltransferase involved in cell wall biosynthesis